MVLAFFDGKEEQVLCQQHITERIQPEYMEPVMESETDHRSVIHRIAVRSVRMAMTDPFVFRVIKHLWAAVTAVCILPDSESAFYG